MNSKYTAGTRLNVTVARFVTREVAGKGQEKYGVVCDIDGSKDNGLLHVSQLGIDRNSGDARLAGLNIGDKLEVEVIARDGARGISLSERVVLKAKAVERLSEAATRLVKGTVITGTVVGTKVFSQTSAGVFVQLEEGVVGMCHDTELVAANKQAQEQRVLGFKGGEQITVAVKEDAKVEDGRIRVSLSEKAAAAAAKVSKAADVVGQLNVGDVLKGKVVGLEADHFQVEVLDCVVGKLGHDKLGSAVKTSVSKLGVQIRVKVEEVGESGVIFTRIGV